MEIVAPYLTCDKPQRVHYVREVVGAVGGGARGVRHVGVGRGAAVGRLGQDALRRDRDHVTLSEERMSDQINTKHHNRVLQRTDLVRLGTGH